MELSDLSEIFLRFSGQGNLSKVKECMEKGVDINKQNEDGDTAARLILPLNLMMSIF